MWSSRIPPWVALGDTRPVPTRRAAARSCRRSPSFEFASRGMRRRRSPTKSSSTIARLVEARRSHLGPPQPEPLEGTVRGASGTLLAVEEDEVDRVAGPPDGARELSNHGGARRAVVGPHEPGKSFVS